LAGKKSYAHLTPIDDVWFMSKGQAKIRLGDEIIHAIQEKKFSAIVIDRETPWYSEIIEKYYKRQRRVSDNPNVFWPVTGFRIRPGFIYIPKKIVLIDYFNWKLCTVFIL